MNHFRNHKAQSYALDIELVLLAFDGAKQLEYFALVFLFDAAAVVNNS